jgi:hypothetical protein
MCSQLKLNPLVKTNWNLVEKWKFLTVNRLCNWCNNHIFSNFLTIRLLSFFIEFKICKVGIMHSYKCDGKKKKTFGLRMKEK